MGGIGSKDRAMETELFLEGFSRASQVEDALHASQRQVHEYK